MGYTTKFTNKITVDPPLSADEIEYLNKFADTRRMKREKGPYYVDGSGFRGQGCDPDIIHDQYPDDQPGYWCQWVPNEKGTAIKWDGGEKFYRSVEWMEYLINHFIGDNPIVAKELPFFTGHKCDGMIRAQGEVPSDKWILIVANNVVSKIELTKEVLKWIKENKINLRSIEGQLAVKLRWL